MNYYEHHIGDFLKKTVHLTVVEEGIYRRLLDRYYITEGPLPADVRECCKLARASSRKEREAVATVLKEFFHLEADGYHQRRADEEIARFHDKHEKAKRSAEARWNAQRSQSDGNASASPDDMRPHMRTQCEGDANAMRRRCSQTPDTRHQTPEEINTLTADSTEVGLCGGGGGGPPDATPAGLVCRAMKAAGIADVNPGHAELLALLQAGATQAEFVGAAEEAVRRHKGFAYALGMLKRQRQEAAKVKHSLHHGPLPAADDARARQLETAALMTGRASAGTTQETIDVASRVIPS